MPLPTHTSYQNAGALTAEARSGWLELTPILFTRTLAHSPSYYSLIQGPWMLTKPTEEEEPRSTSPPSSLSRALADPGAIEMPATAVRVVCRASESALATESAGVVPPLSQSRRSMQLRCLHDSRAVRAL
jgi:hypothetical protein